MALDDYCVSFVYTKTGGPIQRLSSVSAPAIQRAIVQGVSPTEYRVVWNITSVTEAQALIGEFEAVGFTRAVDWTAPDENASAKFRFTAFSPSFVSPQLAIITATLRRFQGVS